MEIEIVQNKENPLLSRNEVDVLVKHQGKATPNRIEVQNAVSKQLKTEPKLVLVDRLFTLGGRNETTGKIYVFKKEEDIPKDKLTKIQNRAKKIKNAAKEETKAEEPAPQKVEKKEEPKKEPEKKEEPKSEETPKEKPEKKEPTEEKEAPKAEKGE